MLISVESTTCQRPKATRSILWKNLIIAKILSIFKYISPPEEFVAEKSEVRIVEPVFQEVSKNVAIFNVDTWEVLHAQTYHLKFKNEHFEN